MVVENLTQRSDELIEVTENLACIRKYLKFNSVQELNEIKKTKTNPKGAGREEESGSTRQIYNWLSKNGEVMSIGKISEYLKVHDNLDGSLLKSTVRAEGGVREDEEISIEEAKNLARLDIKDQLVMKEILDETELNHKGKSRLIAAYNKSTPEIQEKVKSGEIDIIELQSKIESDKNKKAYDEAIKSKDSELRIIRSGEILQNVREEIINTTRELDRFFFKVKAVKFNNLTWSNPKEQKSFRVFVDDALKKANLWVSVLEKIKSEIEYEN
jgi:hypothetical protein